MTNAGSIEFTKMQGTGNDFVVIDNRALRLSRDELAEFAANWCPRRYGIGADGLLALDRPDDSVADYRMYYVNADGSWATMCGNGARCLAQFARDNGFDGRELAFETDAGLYRARIGEEGGVRLYVRDVQNIDLDVELEQNLPNGLTALHFAHAGTEHLVTFVESPDAVPVEKWGRQLRRDPSLEPEGANVNFVGLDADGDLRVRTFEKGVEAETLSCGTGVLASAVVAEETGQANDGSITVYTKGGTLRVGTDKTARGRERFLEGPAATVYGGRVDA